MTTPDPMQPPPPGGPVPDAPPAPDAPPPAPGAPPAANVPPPPDASAGPAPSSSADPVPSVDAAPAGESRHDRRERRREERRERRQLDGGPTPAGLVFGIILVVGGAIVLLGRLTDLTLGPSAWPLWLIVPGVAMILGSFAIPPRGGLGLAIPGAILAMVGVVLWFQATNDLYATWAYAWALVAPTGVGLGMLLYGLARRDGELARDGLRTTLVGIGLFIGFAFFFEGILGLSGREFPNVREAAPYVSIVFGVLLVISAFVTGRKPTPAA